jgi:molybdopterin-guanine dinucleotide biosynthesis protein A
MGRPKALIEVGGIPLWRRQVELLQRLGPTDLMISAGTDWAPGAGSWTVIRDRIGGLGPLGGIDAALASMATDLLLVLAVDMPSMSADYLGRLLRGAGSTGIVPEDRGLYQGLAAVYPRSLGALVEEALGGEDRSLQRLLAAAVSGGLMAATRVAEGDRTLFRNVNTPADL